MDVRIIQSAVDVEKYVQEEIMECGHKENEKI